MPRPKYGIEVRASNLRRNLSPPVSKKNEQRNELHDATFFTDCRPKYPYLPLETVALWHRRLCGTVRRQRQTAPKLERFPANFETVRDAQHRSLCHLIGSPPGIIVFPRPHSFGTNLDRIRRRCFSFCTPRSNWSVTPSVSSDLTSPVNPQSTCFFSLSLSLE